MRILVTRPIEQAGRTAAKLAALAHDAVIAPLLEIRYCDDVAVPCDGVQALIFTSSNGARAFAKATARRDKAVFAVGSRTAEVAHALGFANVRSCDGDSAALACAVAQWADPQAGALLHAAGKDSAGDFAGALAAAGFTVKRVVLYRAVAADTLPDAARRALAEQSLDAVLIYSPRSAAVFARLAAGYDMAGSMAVCISKAAAQPLESLGFRGICVAARPAEDDMLQCLS